MKQRVLSFVCPEQHLAAPLLPKKSMVYAGTPGKEEQQKFEKLIPQYQWFPTSENSRVVH